MLKINNNLTEDNKVVVKKTKNSIVLEVPPSLSLNPFFKEILCLDAEKLFDFNIKALDELGYKDIDSFFDPTEGYIFARGTLPVCLCAHMDKVPHYSTIKTLHKKAVLSADKQKIIDVIVSSDEGIGGDDRCGVYAILSMLKLGHRPSVLFCMGEEIGCRGSRKFCNDHKKDFLDDINAFIQIDRRGRDDCVRYSDSNSKLTKAICKFGYKHAYGSCTDISVLMPHFGISGVNLSSGYYHEHTGKTEYVSIHDVNTLLTRVDKILHSKIFKHRYVYESFNYSYSRFTRTFDEPSREPNDNFKQISLFDNFPYDEPSFSDMARCDYCGQFVARSELVETDDILAGEVCEDCAKELTKLGFVKCSSCGKLYKPDNYKGKLHKFCPFCGTLNDEHC